MLGQKSVVAPFSISVRNEVEGGDIISHTPRTLISRAPRILALFTAKPVTVSEYLFAAAMTVLIVWLVVEISGEDVLKL
jgi:hypothetical protein